MATEDKSFDILGSSKLNTADGKNPTSSSTVTSSHGRDESKSDTGTQKEKCKSAHDALEDRLREEERMSRK